MDKCFNPHNFMWLPRLSLPLRWKNDSLKSYLSPLSSFKSCKKSGYNTNLSKLKCSPAPLHSDQIYLLSGITRPGSHKAGIVHTGILGQVVGMP